MKIKLKTRRIKHIRKYRNNKKTKYRSKHKKTIKNRHKQRIRITRKNNMRGGNTQLNGESRFIIEMKTNEIENYDKNVLQKHFLIVTDKLRNKTFLINIGTVDYVNLFLFEKNIQQNKDNVYLYHIDCNLSSIENIPFELIKNYVNDDKVYRSIVNNGLDIENKIELLSLIDSKKFISINIDDDVTEIVNDYNINKDNTITALNELNKILRKTCPNLELKFDYLINQPGILSVLHMYNLLTLCLYNQGNCIASVVCMIKPHENNFWIVIGSQTNPSMQGKNFNKLLRAAIINIANLVTVNGKNIQGIFSEAENPISALLLLKYFNANVLNDDYLNEKVNKEFQGNKRSLITHDFIKEYMEEYGDIQLFIELNAINIAKAKEVFETTTINCNDIERKWNQRIITKEIEYDSDDEIESDS